MDEREYDGLIGYLVQLVDTRGRQGRIYPWHYLLGCWAAAFAAGARGPLAVHEWCAAHFEVLHLRFGSQARGIPSESTFQRLFQRIQPDHLERLVEAHNGDLVAPVEEAGPTLLPVDGKVVRQASAHGERHWLLGLASEQGFLLRQRRVPQGTNEQGALPLLLADLDLAGCLVTTDAGLCSRPTAQQIREAGGDFLLQVKGDCEALYADLVAWFESPERRGERAHTKVCELGHGRYERRELEVSVVTDGWLDDWPGVRLVLRRTCQRTCAKSGEPGKVEHSYAICSLDQEDVSAGQLLAWWRGHWGIENRVHYVRDVTFGEDRRAVWKATAPQVLAALGNAVLARIRSADRWRSVASALRWASYSPIHAMQLVGLLPL